MRKASIIGNSLLLVIFIGVFMAVALPKVVTEDSIKNNNAIKNETIKKTKTTIKEKKEKEKRLLAELKKIPASEIYTNRDKYKELLSMFKTNKKYKNKFTYYSNKVKELESRIGKYPSVSSWDGVPYVVERYIKRIANDPDSIEFEGCTALTYSSAGWNTMCKVRGKNAFGGKILSLYKFTIKNNQVTNAKQL